MSVLVQLALAPAVICLGYIFIRDKYEKEPIRLLLVGVLFGAYTSAVVLAAGRFIVRFENINGEFYQALYKSFISSAGIEELIKFIFLFFLVWKNKNFNERFDGIVYAVFISIGFAGVENILYVVNPTLGGFETAINRAIFSVPGHGFFGVVMGYYFALSKFEEHEKGKHLVKALFMPWFFHAIYNLTIFIGNEYYLILFIPFLIFLWRTGFNKIKIHLENSPFKSIKLRS